MTDFTERVYRTVRRVPRGQIVSYGGVAAILGSPRAARGVGHALHALPDGSDVPWWRVVNRHGEISIRGAVYAARLQRVLLEAEGVSFDERGRIDWCRFGWDGLSAAEASARPVMIKQSVALAITDAARPGLVLIVQRPDDDADLPGVWGLPAASLRDRESWQDAGRRAGQEKLGVELAIGAAVAEGHAERSDYTLHMRLYDAQVAQGSPHVPQAAANVTQYAAWRWGSGADLRPAAERGSLCSTLYLRASGT